MKTIKYKTKAIRQIKKIDNKKNKQLITSSINELKNYPDPRLAIKKYKTTDLLRLKVKQWRIFFTADLDIVYIEQVRKRNERTYK